MASRSSIPAGINPWIEEPGRLQSMGLQSLTWLKWLSSHTSINLKKTNFSNHKTLNKDDRQDGQMQNPTGSRVMEYQLSEHQPKQSTTTDTHKRGKEIQNWRVKYEQDGEVPKKRVNVRRETIIARKVPKQRKDLVVSKVLLSTREKQKRLRFSLSWGKDMNFKHKVKKKKYAYIQTGKPEEIQRIKKLSARKWTDLSSTFRSRTMEWYNNQIVLYV